MNDSSINEMSNSSWFSPCNISSYEQTLEEMVEYTIPVIYIAEFLAGILGNLLVVVVCLSDKQNRSPTTVFMLNLSIADLLVCTFVLPATVFLIFSQNGWVFGNILCKLNFFSQNVTVFISIYTMVAMSVDRFLAVVYAIESIVFRTHHNAVRTVCVIWIVTLIVNSPLLLITRVRHGDGGMLYCEPNWNMYFESGFQLYAFFVIFLAYLLPLLAIVCLYFILVRSLWKNRGIRQSEESLRSKRLVTKMVIIVVILFALSLLPINIVYLVQSLDYWDRCSFSQYLLLVFAYVSFYFNNICNPFVYAFKSENFQKSMIKRFTFLTKFEKSKKKKSEKTTIVIPQKTRENFSDVYIHPDANVEHSKV